MNVLLLLSRRPFGQGLRLISSIRQVAYAHSIEYQVTALRRSLRCGAHDNQTWCVCPAL